MNKSLRSPMGLLVAATAILALSISLMFHDITHANRPHELKNAPWVAGLSFLNLLPCTFAILRLVRAAKAGIGESNPSRSLLFLALGVAFVVGLNLLILFLSASSVPAVLGS